MREDKSKDILAQQIVIVQGRLFFLEDISRSEVFVLYLSRVQALAILIFMGARN